MKVNVEEAEGHLGQLIEKAAGGQEVVITADDGSAVRLVPLSGGERSHRPQRAARMAGDPLHRFIGTWSAEQLELLRTIDVCKRADDSLRQ